MILDSANNHNSYGKTILQEMSISSDEDDEDDEDDEELPSFLEQDSIRPSVNAKKAAM